MLDRTAGEQGPAQGQPKPSMNQNNHHSHQPSTSNTSNPVDFDDDIPF
jgi:hypothetical protein